MAGRAVGFPRQSLSRAFNTLCPRSHLASVILNQASGGDNHNSSNPGDRNQN